MSGSYSLVLRVCSCAELWRAVSTSAVYPIARGGGAAGAGFHLLTLKFTNCGATPAGDDDDDDESPMEIQKSPTHTYISKHFIFGSSILSASFV